MEPGLFVVWALPVGLLFKFLGQVLRTMAAEAEIARELARIRRALGLKIHAA
jgi:hypothetical protein